MKSMFTRSGAGSQAKRFRDHFVCTLTDDATGEHVAYYDLHDDGQRVTCRWRDIVETVPLDGLDAPTRCYRWLYSMVGAVGKKGAH